jgi:hypothetical protein
LWLLYALWCVFLFAFLLLTQHNGEAVPST